MINVFHTSKGATEGGISTDKLSNVLNQDFFKDFKMSISKNSNITFEEVTEENLIFY